MCLFFCLYVWYFMQRVAKIYLNIFYVRLISKYNELVPLRCNLVMVFERNELKPGISNKNEQNKSAGIISLSCNPARRR